MSTRAPKKISKMLASIQLARRIGLSEQLAPTDQPFHQHGFTRTSRTPAVASAEYQNTSMNQEFQTSNQDQQAGAPDQQPRAPDQQPRAPQQQPGAPKHFPAPPCSSLLLSAPPCFAPPCFSLLLFAPFCFSPTLLLFPWLSKPSLPLPALPARSCFSCSSLLTLAPPCSSLLLPAPLCSSLLLSAPPCSSLLLLAYPYSFLFLLGFCSSPRLCS